MSDDQGRRNGGDFVQSLERGLRVIRAFDAEHRSLALTDVAQVSGLPRAAARRFLLTLVELGYVRADDGRFSLTPRVLELGYSYLAGLGLPDVAQPHMEALMARVEESVSLAVLDGTEIVFIGGARTRRVMSGELAVGTRLPAHATSMGRVLLAALPEDELEARLARIELRPLSARTIVDRDALRAVLDRVRSEGWAAVDQELEAGLRTLAVPIRDSTGETIAALNVSVHAGRGSMTRLRRDLLPLVRAAAAAIESELADGRARHDA